VSPTDLAKACGMFSRLRLPVKLKTFKSGLVVLLDASFTEDVVERNLLMFVEGSGGGVTALEVGRKFHWSIGVSMELLQVSLFFNLRFLIFRRRRIRGYYVEMLQLKEFGFGRIDFVKYITLKSIII
jgi:hypothetical protein